MKLVIVAMRDAAVAAYGTPMFVPSIGAAIRSLGDQINRKEQGDQLGSHPEDFEMFELGSFDTETAVFDMLETPRSVARGKDLVRA